MYFLTLWNARLFVVLFRMFGIQQLLLFLALMERMTIRVSVYKAIFCGSRSLDGISRYISVNFPLFVSLI